MLRRRLVVVVGGEGGSSAGAADLRRLLRGAVAAGVVSGDERVGLTIWPHRNPSVGKNKSRAAASL